MITISVCMIVKNEANVLARCLDSLKEIADEIVIVDTGSTDDTKQIASEYTDQIYDFTWVDDFSAARNESFAKATKDYIYVADADEVLAPEEIEKFKKLKETLSPSVEIVQMFYGNQLEHNTVYNFDCELRPKLYKRVRQFTWKDPVHESVELEPVILDSDICVTHLPESNHAKRDFAHYVNAINSGEGLSKKLQTMYAKELMIAGEKQDFITAWAYFLEEVTTKSLTEEQLKTCEVVLVKAAHLQGDVNNFFKMVLHNVADGKPCAEVCYELGLYYEECEDYEEASIWFYNAAFETESQCNIHTSGDWPLEHLAQCYEQQLMLDEAARYRNLAREWQKER